MVTAVAVLIVGILIAGWLQMIHREQRRAARLQLVIAERLLEIDDVTARIWASLKSASEARVVKFYAIIDGQKIRIEDMKVMQIAQLILITAEFFDKQGDPAVVDGLPKWGVSDESVASIVPSEDGMSATLTALKAGSVKVLLLADSDMGEGVKDLKGESEEIVVLAGEAVAVKLSLGEPTDAPVVEEPPVEEPPVEEPAPVEPAPEEAKAASKKKAKK